MLCIKSKAQRLQWKRNALERSAYSQAHCGSRKRLNNSGNEEIESSSKRSRLSNSGATLSEELTDKSTPSKLWIVELPRFIRFVLVKNDLEHSEALQMINSALSTMNRYYHQTTTEVAPPPEVYTESTGLPQQQQRDERKAKEMDGVHSILHSSSSRAISVHGTKDRRGITLQWCTVEILPSWIYKNQQSNPIAMKYNDNNNTDNGNININNGCLQNEIHNASNSTLAFPLSVQILIGVLEAATKALLAMNRGSDLGVQILPGRRNLSVGNVSYAHSPLQLGKHWGNRFVITLRDVVALGLSQEMSICKAGSCNSTPTDCSRLDCALCVFRNRLIPKVVANGFPNYFGSQRFGVLSIYCSDRNESSVFHNTSNSPQSDISSSTEPPIPIGALLGKLLIFKRFSTAMDVLIMGNTAAAQCMGRCFYCSTGRLRPIAVSTSAQKGGEKNTYADAGVEKDESNVDRARRLYACGQAPSAVLKCLPLSMTKERQALLGLVRSGSNRNSFGVSCSCQAGEIMSSPSHRNEAAYLEALESISFHVRNMWISAYQSWLWNRVCSYRLFECSHDTHLDVHTTPMIGDIVSLQQPALVDLSAEPICSHVVISSNAQLSTSTIDDIVIPLFGSHVTYPSNDTGRFNDLFDRYCMISYKNE